MIRGFDGRRRVKLACRDDDDRGDGRDRQMACIALAGPIHSLAPKPSPAAETSSAEASWRGDHSLGVPHPRPWECRRPVDLDTLIIAYQLAVAICHRKGDQRMHAKMTNHVSHSQ